MSNTRTKSFPRARSAEYGESRGIRVEVIAGADSGLSAVLARGGGIVGRGDTADVRLADPTVSQFHVELASVAGGIQVRDLTSLNGTYLHEARLRDAIVADQSELSLGSTMIRVCLDAASVVERSKVASFGELVGFAPTMREMFAVLERLSQSDLAVLIEGAAGTGKETVARAIASAGAREPSAVYVVECATLPRHLAEASLVGPSGALAIAAGGTLILLDVAELSADVQRALVRALEETERPRMLSTSRTDVRALVNRGVFREDLYYAIAQACVRVPSLADRREDVRGLVHHFLAQIPWSVQAARAIEPDALEVIEGQELKNNVRDLRTLVERVAKVADGPSITCADLDFARLLGAERPSPDASADTPLEDFKEAKRTVIDEFERAYVGRLLVRAGSNLSRAAAIAGIDRQSLRSLLRRHGLKGEE